MLSGAGGAVAHRRRDFLTAYDIFSTLWILGFLFGSLVPPISFHHQLLLPLFTAAVSPDGARGCFPVNHLRPSARFTSCALKLAKDEALASKSLKFSKSEICLCYSHGLAFVGTISRFHRRYVVQSAAVEEPYSALAWARSFISKPASSLDLDLSRWHRSSSILLDRIPQTPTKTPSSPATRSPSPISRLSQTCSASIIEKLGFCLLGFVHLGPLILSLGFTYNCGGRTLFPFRSRSVSITKLTSLCILLSRHNAKIGRGFHLRIVSTIVQGLVDHLSTDLNQIPPLTTTRDPTKLHQGTIDSNWRMSDPMIRHRSVLNSKSTFSVGHLRQTCNKIGRGLQSFLRRSWVQELVDLSLMAFKAQLLSGFLVHDSIISDLEGFWHPSLSVIENASALPSSFMERIIQSFLAVSMSFMPVTQEAKNLSPTSYDLLIMTIVKSPEVFAGVSLTHHDLACGMLPCSLYLRVPMDLSSKLKDFLSYLAIFLVFLGVLNLVVPLIVKLDVSNLLVVELYYPPFGNE